MQFWQVFVQFWWIAWVMTGGRGFLIGRFFGILTGFFSSDRWVLGQSWQVFWFMTRAREKRFWVFRFDDGFLEVWQVSVWNSGKFFWALTGEFLCSFDGFVELSQVSFVSMFWIFLQFDRWIFSILPARFFGFWQVNFYSFDRLVFWSIRKLL